MNKGDKFYELFNCWLSNSRARNSNKKLSFIILNTRLSAVYFFCKLFSLLAVFFLFIYCKWANELWASAGRISFVAILTSYATENSA